MQWSKVAWIESKQQFIVTTANGSVYAGLVKTAEMPADSLVSIEVEAEGSHMLLERALIVELNHPLSDRKGGLLLPKGRQIITSS